jgi:hypothetical protein
MRPVVNGLEREHAGRLKLVVLDYDVKEDLAKAKALNADYHPSMAFIRPDGSVMRVVIGFQSADRIRQNVEALLGG